MRQGCEWVVWRSVRPRWVAHIWGHTVGGVLREYLGDHRYPSGGWVELVDVEPGGRILVRYRYLEGRISKASDVVVMERSE